nr:hypothetical protein [Escherichia coli]
MLVICALVGVRLSTTDKTKRSRGDRQRKSKPRCLYSIYGEKRMINLLIIVLRAVAALANALIAVLELIRQFID